MQRVNYQNWEMCRTLLLECVQTEPIRLWLFAQAVLDTFNGVWFQSILSETTSTGVMILYMWLGSTLIHRFGFYEVFSLSIVFLNGAVMFKAL